MAISNNIETWKILLIEDNPIDTRVIQESLKDASSKIKLEITDRLSTGMEILRDENFDALLLDLNLPDAMGLEALNKILTFTTDLPIIILTGLADEELGSKAIREGAQDYLFKQSVDTPSLTRSIRYAIERKQVEKQLRMNEERIRDNQKKLSTILDTIHTGVVIIDRKTHQIVDANAKAIEMIGGPEEDIINSVCHKFICPTNKGKCPVTDLGKKVNQSERILLTAGGEIIPIIKSVKSVTLSGHEYLVESFTDISERKGLEQHLMQSRAKLEYLLRNNPAVIYSCEARGEFRTTFMSENIRELSGYESQEFLSKPNFWVNCMHPEDRERIFSSFSELPEKGYYNETYRIKHKNGTYRWVFEEARLLKDNQGDPLEIVGYWTDISQLKQAEFELHESERRYLHLVDVISDIFFSLSPDGIILSLNKAFEALTGWSREEFIGKQFIELLLPDDIPTSSRGFETISRGGKATNLGMRIKSKSNEFLILEGRVTPQYNEGELIGFVGVARDITERKKAEEVLRESEEKLKDFYENAPDMYASVDPRTATIIQCNQTLATYLGYTKEEIIGNPVIEIYHPDCMEDVKKAFQFFLKTGEVHDTVLQLKRKDGSKIDVSLNVSAVRDEQGDILHSRSSLRDISERVRLEESIRESEEKYRFLVEKSAEGIAIIQDQRYKYVNPSFAKIVGYSSNELINFSPEEIWSLIHPDDKDGLEKRNRDLEAGRTLAPKHIFRYIRKDGLTRWVEASGNDTLFEGRPALQVFENDITKRKLAEMKLRESEEKYRTILENIEEGYYEVDLAGNLTFFNDSLAKSLGYSYDELMGMNNRQYMDDMNAKKVFLTFNEVYKSGKPQRATDWEIIRKDGSKRFHEDSVSLLSDSEGNPIGFSGIARDVTDRRLAEQELQRSEANLHTAQRIAHLGSWHWKIEPNNISWSEEVFRIFGLDSEKVNPSFETFMSSVHPNDREFVERSTNDALYKNKPYNIEHRIVRPNGEERYVNELGEVIYNETGQSISMIGTVHDITERKVMEEEIILQRNELQQRTHDLEERVKELNCLHSVSKLTKETKRSHKEIFQEIIALIPLSWQYPEITCARIIFEKKTITTDNFRETNWKQSVDIILFGNKAGTVEVYYLEEKPENFEGPFLKEECDLLEAIAREIGEFIELKRAQEAIKESEDRYRTLFEEIPIGLYRTTPDGKFLAVNPSFVNMLGFTSKDLALSDVITVASKVEYSREKFQETIEREGTISGFEMQVRRLDGSTIFVRENAKAIKDTNGSVLYYEGTFEDITESKLLEESLLQMNDELAAKVQTATKILVKEKTRIETIVETTPVGMLVLNSDGSLVLANRTFNDLFQKIFQEDLPYDFNINTQQNNILVDEIKQNFVSIESIPRTIEPIEGLHLQIHSAPMGFPGEQPFGILIEFFDVTPFVEFEITQKQFVATVSHELRTPITVLDLSIKNLQKYWKKLSEKQREEVFSLVIKSTFSLKQIIEDVLIISKIETREFKLQMAPFLLRKVLNDMIAQFDSRLREFGVTVQIDVNPQLELYGDPKRIGKIFSILLDNAIKFSPDGESTVKIIAIDDYRGEYNPEDVDGVLIEVIDFGRGISEEDIPRIFDRFFKSTDTKDIPGIGIGLFIAKMLVKHHQGHIFVKSMIGKGSTFSVFLPKNESNQIN